MPYRIFLSGLLMQLPFLAAAHAEDCAALTRLQLDHAAVTDARVIPHDTVPESSPDGNAVMEKADYCRIQGTSKPSADSEIRFEVWIPSGAGWNGKFEQVGNSGYAGMIPYRLMGYLLSLGYAVAGTDDGHRSTDVTDASWALNHPEKVKDFGWRAIDETARVSKQILLKLTAQAPAKSYFVGCSDGGREALMMAQRFPTYFDGIIAGAPFNAMTRVLTGGALQMQALGGSLGHLSSPQLALLQHHALQSCGNGATYLKDPSSCHVDLAPLKCTGAAAACLSDEQMNAARVIYAQRKDPLSGKPLYGVLPGAESVSGSWDVWLMGGEDQKPPAGIQFTWNYLAYMVMHDPKFDLKRVSLADIVRGERLNARMMNSDNPDLSAFRAHGGKLIQYHGWNDPAIPPGYSLEYRDRMAAKTGNVNDFYRLYMVPGMLHCGGGDAPTQVNWQAALEAWVEKTLPPGELIARDGKGTTQILAPFN